MRRQGVEGNRAFRDFMRTHAIKDSAALQVCSQPKSRDYAGRKKINGGMGRSTPARYTKRCLFNLGVGPNSLAEADGRLPAVVLSSGYYIDLNSQQQSIRGPDPLGTERRKLTADQEVPRRRR